MTTAILGIGLAISILVLIRGDHLYIRDGLFWILVAAAAVLFGIYPGISDQLARWVGVSSGSSLIFAMAVVVILVKILLADLALSRLRRDLRRLNQEIAMAGELSPASQDAPSAPDLEGHRS